MADDHRSSRRERRSGKWLRQYPPLVTFVVALLIMFLVMPSALNLPQANPSTVLEYAPVPPEDEDPPPPPQSGSLSDLSLGSSATVTDEGTQEVPDVPEDDSSGEGEEPRLYRCVDPDGDGPQPARQTEDPNAPPCVPFFEGDNGGATFQGVTKDEITILVYADGGIQTVGGDKGYETTPDSGTYCDIDSAPQSDPNCMNGEETSDHTIVQAVRAYCRYFNARFQTYGRRAHCWVYWAGSGEPASRRSDAQDNWERLKPFSVMAHTYFHGNGQAYVDAAAKRRMMVYGSFSLLPNEVYRDNAPFMWSFWPDVEHSVDMYVDYICKRVAPYPVTNSGVESFQGEPRRYALLRTSDDAYPGLQYFAQEAERKLRRGCPNGHQLDIVDEYTYPRNGFYEDTHPDAISTARTNIADMQSKDITTILWLSGYETQHSRAAQSNDYYPEWIVAGDLRNDQIEENQPSSFGPGQGQEAWRYAWVVSNQLREEKESDAPCRQAFREAAPNATEQEEDEACAIYRGLFMMFRGIQVAGPFLTPTAVDEGNHAIPATRSTSPYVAACFFDPGDYSCVKDAHEAWWDPDAPDPGGSPDASGCWRMVNGGTRYPAGSWPEANGPTQFNPDEDPCNNAGDNSASINPYGPAG